jgi:hypothetical protein
LVHRRICAIVGVPDATDTVSLPDSDPVGSRVNDWATVDPVPLPLLVVPDATPAPSPVNVADVATDE